MRREGYNEFITEISSHILKSGQITIAPPGQKWDILKKEDGSLFFGVTENQNSAFEDFIYSWIKVNSLLGIILRSFTNITDPVTNFPVKELRGYLLALEDDTLKLSQLSAEDLASSFDSPEQDVIYCGKDSDYLDANLKPLLYK